MLSYKDLLQTVVEENLAGWRKHIIQLQKPIFIWDFWLNLGPKPEAIIVCWKSAKKNLSTGTLETGNPAANLSENRVWKQVNINKYITVG